MLAADFLTNGRLSDWRSPKIQRVLEAALVKQENVELSNLLKKGANGECWFFEVGAYSPAYEGPHPNSEGFSPKLESELRTLMPLQDGLTYLSSVDQSGIVENIVIRGTSTLRFCPFGAGRERFDKAVYVYSRDAQGRPCLSLQSAKTLGQI